MHSRSDKAEEVTAHRHMPGRFPLPFPVLLALLLLLLGTAQPIYDDPPVSHKTIQDLCEIATLLAGSGRSEESFELLDVIQALECPRELLLKARTICWEARADPSPAVRLKGNPSRELRKIARDMAAALPGM